MGTPPTVLKVGAVSAMQTAEAASVHTRTALGTLMANIVQAQTPILALPYQLLRISVTGEGAIDTTGEH